VGQRGWSIAALSSACDCTRSSIFRRLMPEIAELLSGEAREASYVLQRAYRRAARSAFLWEVEMRDLVAQKRPLTELAYIGPFLAGTRQELRYIPPSSGSRSLIPRCRNTRAHHSFASSATS
jgi:hypothetical protein